MPDRRELVNEELKAITTDVKSLVETLTTDPKALARKERRWRILYGVLGAVSTVLARRIATKVWTVLTGEPPPGKQPAQAKPAEQSREPERVQQQV